MLSYFIAENSKNLTSNLLQTNRRTWPTKYLNSKNISIIYSKGLQQSLIVIKLKTVITSWLDNQMALCSQQTQYPGAQCSSDSGTACAVHAELSVGITILDTDWWTKKRGLFLPWVHFLWVYVGSAATCSDSCKHCSIHTQQHHCMVNQTH